jgi:serine/threonine protein kinase
MQSIETDIPGVVRTAAGLVLHFLRTQPFSNSENMVFFRKELANTSENKLSAASIPRFTALLTQLSQSSEILNNADAHKNFLILKRYLATANNSTVMLGRSRPLSAPDSQGSAKGLERTKNSNPQRLIGKYEVTKKIGEGGNGIVYLGRNPVSNQQVALKVLSNRQGHDEIKAIREEAKIAAKVTHPNCVKVLDMVIDEGTQSPVIVSEFIAGPNGRAFLDLPIFLELPRPGALPPRAALLMLEQMVRGMRAAHAAGIVHRDIKPENFLVSNDVVQGLAAIPKGGDKESQIIQVLESFQSEAWVQLSDWGLALQRQNMTIGNSHTFDLGHIPLHKQGGTLVYMPLEQINQEHIGRKSDVFSLGLVFYELLTGAHAQEARHYAEDIPNTPDLQIQTFLVKIASAQSQAAVAPTLDPHLQLLREHSTILDFLNKMCMRDREQRMGSREVEDAVNALLADQTPDFAKERSKSIAPVVKTKVKEATATSSILMIEGILLLVIIGLLFAIVVLARSEKPEVRNRRLANEGIWQEIKAGQLRRVAKLTWLPEEVAKQLVETSSKTIDLNSLSILEVRPANRLSGHNGPLKLNGLKSLSLELATELSDFKGDLFLNRLKELNPRVSSALGAFSCKLISLGGLSTIGDDDLRNLSSFSGPTLALNGLESLSLVGATALQSFSGELQLNGLSQISNEALMKLASRPGAMDLGLTSLTVKQATILIGHNAPLYLNKVRNIRVDVLKTLTRRLSSERQKTRKTVSLKGLLALDEPALIALGQSDVFVLSLVTQRAVNAALLAKAKAEKSKQKPTLPVAVNPLSVFASRYGAKITQITPLIVKENRLSDEELRKLIKYRGDSLVLHLTSLGENQAKILAQSKANGLNLLKLKSLRYKDFAAFKAFKGKELYFSAMTAFPKSGGNLLPKFKVEAVFLIGLEKHFRIDLLTSIIQELQDQGNKPEVYWSDAINAQLGAVSGTGGSKAPRGAAKSPLPRGTPNSGRRPSPNPGSQNSRIAKEITGGNLKNISSVTVLGPKVTKTLVDLANTLDFEFLNLSSLTKLPAASAMELSQFRGQLILSSIYRLESGSIVPLLNFKGTILEIGLKPFTKADALLLSRLPKVLALPNIDKITPEISKILSAGSLTGLALPNLRSLASQDSFPNFAQSKWKLLTLGCPTIEPGDLKALRPFKGVIRFNDWQKVSLPVSKELVQLNAEKIELPRCSGFSADVFAFLKSLKRSRKNALKEKLVLPGPLQKDIMQLLSN